MFGLEVNWDLLQVSVEAKREETAAYMAQVRYHSVCVCVSVCV